MKISREKRIYHALLALYLETAADYIKINHLGKVHHNKSMQDARKALKLKYKP